jgi:phosphoglycolate phosphatase
MNNNFSHIFWDFNGTLFDDAQLSFEIVSKQIENRNLPKYSLEEIKSLFRFPISNFYLDLGFTKEDLDSGRASVEFMDLYRELSPKCSLHNYAINCLELARTKGLTQLILSAHTEDHVIELCDHLKISPYFSEILGATEASRGLSKTNRGKTWIEQKGLDSSKILIIGDSTHDYEVADSIGASCILIAQGHQNLESLSKCPVTVVETLKDVYRLLDY